VSGHSQFSLLGQRRFGPFFAVQALGALNDNIYTNALAALVVFEGARMAGLNTDQVVNLAALVFILPFFLFSALFGQCADKYEKSGRVKLLEVVIMALATLGLWLDHIPLLLLVLFLLGLQSTIFGPIKYGILPQILKKEELVGGNALIEMGTFVAILAGTSPLSWSHMILATLAGTLPAAVLYAMTGALAAGLDNMLLIFALVLAVAGLFWLVGKRIEARGTGPSSK